MNKFLNMLMNPVFFPDATFGAVKCIDTEDLINAKVQGIIVNAFHLRIQADNIAKKGGIKRFMSFPGTVISDSGGWQVLSLVHDNPQKGQITDEGVFFQNELFTPEKSIATQIALGSDIVMCFDDCTRPDVSLDQLTQSVERTIAWAKRCKTEFKKLTKHKAAKPKIFGIIQGGAQLDLRRRCARELIKIGFDGFGFGGHPLDAQGNLVKEIIAQTAALMPNDLPKYAMGVGRPEDIVFSCEAGYQFFDCVIPTREARHKRLYVWNKKPTFESLKQGNFYHHLFLNQTCVGKMKPVDENCDCACCRQVTQDYLYYLYQKQEPTWMRLATIHNLRFFTKLTENLARKK